MQFGQVSITPAACQRRFQEGLCLYCGRTGHVIFFAAKRAGSHGLNNLYPCKNSLFQAQMTVLETRTL